MVYKSFAYCQYKLQEIQMQIVQVGFITVRQILNFMIQFVKQEYT